PKGVKPVCAWGTSLYVNKTTEFWN
ncbi:hypothetical protein Pcinc_011853, partial [Petrolisthes cinctipes]